MRQITFYSIEEPGEPTAQLSGDGGKHEADVYCWMERSKSATNRIKRERVRSLGLTWSILVCIASVALGAATWPPAPLSGVAVTKRVYWPECVPLLLVNGKRCN